MRLFSAIVLAYVASKIVFAQFDFHYSPFSDPFQAGKLALDLGVFVGFCMGFNWLLGRLGPFSSKVGD